MWYHILSDQMEERRMQLNPNSQTPLYRQVADDLNKTLNEGAYRPGDKIPSEDQLCQMYRVSRVTLRAAVKLLVEDGKLKKMHGKGTFVSAPVFMETKAGGSFTKFCRQIGAVPRTDLLSSEKIPSSPLVARHLGVEAGLPVCRISRARYINDTAAIFEVDYFRSQDDYILSADVSGSPIADAIKASTGLEAARFEDIFDIARATEEQAIIFRCQANAPLLLVRQTVLTRDRQILYYNEQFILTDRYKYVVSYV